jgi:hypothetical protein
MEESPHGPDVDRLIVPDELVKKLHDANKRFHEAKAKLEGSMESDDYDHNEHCERQFDELRKMESEIEELERKIREIVARKP